MANKVDLLFDSKAGTGLLTGQKGYEVELFDGKASPYDMLLGALGSCFFATFYSVASKKRLTFGEVKLHISGTKREEVPHTLDYVLMKMTITEPSNKEQLLRSAELGAKHCSIHETIAQVAKIELEVEFA